MIRFIQDVKSPLQGHPSEYKNSFNRAVEMLTPDCHHLYISGTASISRGGETLYRGNIDKQIDLTMEVIQSILTSRAMNWTNVNRAIAYFKNQRDIPRFLDYIRCQSLETLPFAIAIADICREDLLFELEADAVAGVSKHNT